MHSLNINKYRKKVLIDAILCSLVMIVILSISKNYISIDVEYTSTKQGKSQIYYRNNSKESPYFDEEHSETKILEASPKGNNLGFNIPYKGLDTLRLDFVNIDQIKIDKISIELFGVPISKYINEDIIQSFDIKNDVELLIEDNTLILKSIGIDSYIGISEYSRWKVDISIIIFALIFTVILEIFFIRKFRYDKLTRGKILILIFMTMLIAPTILYNFIFTNEESDFENKILAEKPSLNINNIQEYPKKVEEYYDDNIPFKKELVSANTFLKYNILGVSPSKAVIKGKDNWLFYDSINKNDQDTLGDYMGTNHYTEEEMKNIKDNLVNIERELNKRNIEFYVMIAPNKMSIYSEYLPDYYMKKNELSKAEVLIDYLEQNTDLKIIHPKEELLKYKDKYQLYYKWDTHWNKQGGYIAFSELMKEVNPANTEISLINELEISKVDKTAADLLKIASITQPKGNEYEYTINYKPDVQVSLIEYQDSMTENKYTYPRESSYTVEDNIKYRYKYQSTSENKNKLLMFRDSFSIAMIPYLRKEFSESTFIWSNLDMKIVDEEKPQVVVYEVVERYLDKLKN